MARAGAIGPLVRLANARAERARARVHAVEAIHDLLRNDPRLRHEVLREPGGDHLLRALENDDETSSDDEDDDDDLSLIFPLPPLIAWPGEALLGF